MQALRWLSAIPRSLLLLLAVVAVLDLSWALVIPAGQAPDEPAHTAYAQGLAENFELPDEKPGLTYSSEQQLAEDRSNSGQTAASLVTRPEWSERAYESWRAAEARLPGDARSDGGHASPGSGPNPARTNPPLYYAWEALPYGAAGGDYFDRLYLMRIWSGLLLLVATAAAWLLIGEVTGPNRLLQLTGAAFVGLQPMATFVSSSVSPDGALIAFWALVLWLGARIVRRGPSTRDAVAICVVAALAVLTKATAYALVPAVGLALAAGWWRSRPRTVGSAARIAVAGLAFVVPVGAWVVASRLLDRSAVNAVPSAGDVPALKVGLLDYLWQYYLPKLPFQDPIPAISRLPAYDVWIKTGWGAFGWLEVRLPGPAYVVLALLTVALVLAGVWALVRRGGNLLVLGFLVLSSVTLLAGLHWVEFRSIVASGTPFNQGRYLLPLLPVLGLLAAAALGLMPRRLQPAASGLLLGGLFALQALSLAVVTARFYA